MKNTSDTSPFNLNCDHDLSKLQKIISFVVNVIRNAPISTLSKNVEVICFEEDHNFQSELTTNLRLNQTPSRNLSNLFWRKINVEKISQVLDGAISVLEVGCGTGRYSDTFSERLVNFSYTGVDIVQHAQWKHISDPRIRFLQSDYLAYSSYLKNCNMIFTQSAVEHFRKDLDFFKTVSEYVESTGTKFVFINLVPPPSSLYCYLWHGIRQYPVRALNRIYATQPLDSKKILVKLGGPSTNRIHRKWITYPTLFLKRDIRSENPNGYGAAMIKSIIHDLKYMGVHRASFFALITLYNMSDEEKIEISDNLFK